MAQHMTNSIPTCARTPGNHSRLCFMPAVNTRIWVYMDSMVDNLKVTCKMHAAGNMLCFHEKQSYPVGDATSQYFTQMRCL